MKNREINNDWDLIIAGGGVTGATLTLDRYGVAVLALD